MLIKLLPEQIDRYWDFLWEKMEDVIIRNFRLDDISVSDSKIRLLEALLRNDVWFFIFEDEGMKALLLIGIEQPMLYPKKLAFVHALRSLRFMDEQSWKRLLDDLAVFVGQLGCQAIIGYSDVSRVCEMVEKFGHNAKTRILLVEARNG